MRRRAREPGDAGRAVELEIAHHIAELADRLVESGWSRSDAEREAASRFGDLSRHRRDMLREAESRGRRLRLGELSSSLTGDVRHALRGLIRHPTFALTVIATLGLGIGAAATVFTVLDPLLLRPLPYQQPDRLFEVSQMRPAGGAMPFLSVDRAVRWNETADVLGPLALYEQTSLLYEAGGEPEPLYGLTVSHELDDVLGVRMAAGRGFTAEDALPGLRRVILGNSFWRRLGAARSLVGSTLELDGVAHEVVGVLPRDFKFPVGGTPPDVWVALGTDHTAGGRQYTRASVVARLADNVTQAVAQARLDVLAAELDRTDPVERSTWRVRLDPVGAWRGNPDLVRGVWMLAGAVALMLLIALTNGVNLLILRGADRARELEVRRALGGSRLRILRQVVCEGVVLGIASGIVALLLTLLASSRLGTLLPGEFAFSSAFEFRVQERILFFTFATALLAGVTLGLIPGVRAVRNATSFGLLKGRGGTDRDRRVTLLLAGAEIALAMMLLAGAGLLAGSFVRLSRVDPGFDADRVAMMAVQLPAARYASPEAKAAFVDRLEQRLERIAGVEGAMIAEGVPPHTGFSFGVRLQADGEDPIEVADHLLFPHMSVPPDYMGLIGARMLAGRDFEPGDAGTDRVLIDNNLAAALWRGAPAVGRRFRFTENGPWYTVIGVYAHMTLLGLDDRNAPYGMILPEAELSNGAFRTAVVRTRGDPDAVLVDMRAAVRAVDPRLPVFWLTSARTALSETIDKPRLLAAVMVALSAIALFLAAIGIYGVLAYSATRRRREMGIRMALGAAPESVRGLIVRQGAGVAIAGVLIGMLGAAAFGRLAGSLLFGVEPGDPATLAGAAAVLIGAALVASWVPARRATGVDPVEVLRAD